MQYLVMRLEKGISPKDTKSHFSFYLYSMEKINIYQAVNDYLAKWDPINLPQEIARVEYVSYVPGIVEVLTDKDKLCSLLMSFLESIGISQENVDMNLRKEVSLRADELMKLHILDLSHEVFLYIINRPPKKRSVRGMWHAMM